MTRKLLLVHNAEVNTASISIRTLQIEGKQVTLAVFRQLLVEDIVSKEPSLRGVGWGHVNYLLDGCDGIHLVWQKGSELRRCIVERKLSVGSFWHSPPAHDYTPQTVERFRQYSEDETLPARNFYREQYEGKRKKLDEWNEGRAAALHAHHQREQWAQSRNALVAPLFDLPQLFIAV
jgi:hypothetical protein